MHTINNFKHQTCKVYGTRHPGLHRHRNEDYFEILQATLPAASGTSDAIDVAIVADGVSSNGGGKEASQIAAQTIRNVIAHAWTTDIPQLLESAIQQANTALFHIAQKQPDLEKMATTVVVAAIYQQRLYVAHVGDSRAYLIRDGKAYRLTRDHTWVQAAIERGELTEADAVAHTKRHVITRYLGLHSLSEVDLAIYQGQQPITAYPDNGQKTADHIRLQTGDSVCLCTDGLFDTVQDAMIGQIIAKRTPRQAVKQLIAAALAAGGPDNITVVTMHSPSPRRLAKEWGIMAIVAAFMVAWLIAQFVAPFSVAVSTSKPVQSYLAGHRLVNALPTVTLLGQMSPLAQSIAHLPTPPTPEPTPTQLPIFTPVPTSRPILPTVTPLLSSVAPLNLRTPISASAQLSVSANTTSTLLRTANLTGTTQSTITIKAWIQIVKPIDGSFDQNYIEIQGNIPQLGPDECLDLVWWSEGSEQFRSFSTCEEIKKLINDHQNIIEVNLRGQFSQGIKYHYAFVIYNQKNRDNSVEHVRRASDELEFVYVGS